jgi:PAS domain S-box-containing protein
MAEQHLGHALDIASEWLMVLEGRRVIYSNHGLLERGERTGESLVGSTLEEVLPGSRCEGLDDLMESMGEVRGKAVSGTIRCHDDVMGSTTLLARGETRGGYTYLSLRRPAGDAMPEDRLLETEDKLSALLGLAASAGLGVGVFEISEGGELLPRSFNEHVMSIFDRDQEEMVGRNPAEWMHPDDRPILDNMVRELQETGSNRAPVQLRALDSSGDVVHIQVANSMLSPPNEHLGISFIQDLTPVREALDQQNRMVQAMDRVQDTVVLADAMGRIFYANSAALRNTGYALEEVIGQPITLFTAPEAAEEFAAQAMVDFLRRGWWRGNTMASTKDGKLYPVEVVGTAVRDDRGELSMIVVISRKTMERQRFEAQLLMAKSNNERLVDHLEGELLPRLEGVIEELEGRDLEDGEDILDGMRATLERGREAISSLPPLEQAQNLRPVRVAKVLSDRLPAMVAREDAGGGDASLTVRQPEGDPIIMANDMLPDLILRIIEVLLEMAEFGHPPRFSVSIEERRISDVRGSRPATTKDGEEPSLVALEITCPGLRLNDDLRSILARQEIHTLGPLTPEQALAVETSRLLLFLYEGRIIIEKGAHTGEDSVVVLIRVA